MQNLALEALYSEIYRKGLSSHALQLIIVPHLRVQSVCHAVEEVCATVVFPAFDVRVEAVAVLGIHAEKGIEHRGKLLQRDFATIDAAHRADAVNHFHEVNGVARPTEGRSGVFFMGVVIDNSRIG